jgi:hypothetical protein
MRAKVANAASRASLGMREEPGIRSECAIDYYSDSPGRWGRTMAHPSSSNCRVQSSALGLERATVLWTMTAKEKLQATVEELSEAEAADALDYIASRRQGASDALDDLLAKAPPDDEPAPADEEAGLVEARDQAARGEVVSAEEIRREFA